MLTLAGLPDLEELFSFPPKAPRGRLLVGALGSQAMSHGWVFFFFFCWGRPAALLNLLTLRGKMAAVLRLRLHLQHAAAAAFCRGSSSKSSSPADSLWLGESPPPMVNPKKNLRLDSSPNPLLAILKRGFLTEWTFAREPFLCLREQKPNTEVLVLHLHVCDAAGCGMSTPLP